MINSQRLHSSDAHPVLVHPLIQKSKVIEHLDKEVKSSTRSFKFAEFKQKCCGKFGGLRLRLKSFWSGFSPFCGRDICIKQVFRQINNL
uniref:Uncharacterized protein n=1 Tax=Meloidogyne hapla TaxID=6305 RepID=A0A1I8BAE8_MELHA